MISLSREPLARAALRFISATLIVFVSGIAAAQDTPAPADAAPAAPADNAAAPADAAAPPADAAAAPAPAEAAPAADNAAGAYDQTVPVQEQTAQADQQTAAQNGEGVKLEKVEVTGSRIKRTDYETAQPVVAISRKDIERSGIVSIGELLQTLPSAGAALNTAFNNGGTGATELDLRNLGCQRVLVLVNGHRWVNGLRSLATNCVDLNTIPISIVERIEVLQDGASAIYGSDAIAGVVNIITRKDVNGGNISLQGGAYAQGGDGAQQNHSISFGHVFGTGAGHTSTFGAINFEDEKGIPTYDRELSRFPKINTGLTRASGFLPDSRIVFVPNPVNGAILGTQKCQGLQSGVLEGETGVTFPSGIDQIPGLQLCDLKHIPGADSSPLYTDYRQYMPPADSYNYATDNVLTTPIRTWSGFVGLNHKFDTLNSSVLHDLNFSFEGLFDYRESRQQLAPQPLCVGEICPIIGGGLDSSGRSINQRTFVSMNNPYNPFHENIGMSLGGQGLYDTGAVLFRPQQVGRRVQEQKVPTFFVRPAIGGTIDLGPQSVIWEAGAAYGQSRQIEHLYHSIRLDHVQLGLGDPANCTGDCVPLDFMHGGALTQAMIDYMTFTGSDVTKQTQKDAFVNLSTNIENIWPSGPIGIAAGFEYRKDHYEFIPDEFAQSGISAGLFSQPTDGSVSAKEEFVELDIPLIRDVPLIKELEADVAGRLSQYATFGNSRNGKAGLRWKPFDDLLLRGTYSSSFRAPNVGDLYLGQVESFPQLTDPCVGRTAGSNADKNCTADGVPSGVTQPNAQITSPFVGNPDLKPESSHSFSAGFVLSPSVARGLDITVDFFRIYLNNFINANDPQFVLNSCYTNDPQHRNFCDQVHRDPNNNNQLTLVFSRFENFAKVITGGVDFNVSYLLPTPQEFGRFKFVGSATFLSSYDQYLPGSQGDIQKTGQTGIFQGGTGAALPRWKINPSLTYTNGGFELAWNTRIVWHVVETCDDGLTPSLTDLGLCSQPNHVAEDGSPAPQNKMRTVAKHDLQATYRLAPSRLAFSVGAQNIFNTDPPISYSAFANSYDPSDYWVPGTLIYAKITKDF